MITKTKTLLVLLLSVFVVQAIKTEEISSNYDEIKTQSMEKEEKYEAYEIPVLKTHDLEDVKLLHSNNSFVVFDKGNIKKVNPCWIDKDIRSVSTERLAKMLGHGYLSVKKMSDGEFKVQAHVRGEGAGPVSGLIAYWITKTLCYGTAVAAASAVTVASGGAIGAAVGAAGTAATLGASAGAAIVGGAIGGAGLAAQATTATAAVVTSAGGLAAAAAAVETASLGVGAFFTAIPFLP